MITKGEWRAEAHGIIVDEEGRQIASVSPHRMSAKLPYGEEQGEANAQLIALSPRMAEWLAKVAKQDFVVFPEDKTMAKEILNSLEEK